MPLYSTSTIETGTVNKIMVKVPAGKIYTVVNARAQQSNTASLTTIDCDSIDGKAIILRNYEKDFPLIEGAYYCTGDVVLKKTGNDLIFAHVSYYDRDLRSDYIGSSTSTAALQAKYIITGGDIVIGGLLLILICFALFGTLRRILYD